MSPLLIWLAEGWRIAFLTFCGPVIGAVLLLAIARLTGARWTSLERLARCAPLLPIAGVLLILAQLAEPASPHLSVWNAPLWFGLRTLIALAGIALAASRLTRGASTIFAGVTLALYAALVTPVAIDWLLSGDPAHSVSSAGMMLFVEQVGGACAVMLILLRGDERFRRDMAALLVAAALGLSYLAYMDYLIIWYGDVPARAGYYAARSDAASVALVTIALLLGLGGPVAALSLTRSERRFEFAGVSALAGLFLFNLWWVGGGFITAVVGVLAGGMFLGWLLLHDRRRQARG